MNFITESVTASGRELAIACGFILVPQCLGYINGIQIKQNSQYYQALKKPFWSPFRFLFRPIWSILYLLMGVSSYLIYRQSNEASVRLPLTVYAVQLFLSALWPTLFFKLQSRFLSLVTIVLVLATSLATIGLFEPISEIAAQLLLPGLARVAISGYLNKVIWRSNQGREFTTVIKKSGKKYIVVTEPEVSIKETDSEKNLSDEEDNIEPKRSSSKSRKVNSNTRCGNCGVRIEDYLE